MDLITAIDMAFRRKADFAGIFAVKIEGGHTSIFRKGVRIAYMSTNDTAIKIMWASERIKLREKGISLPSKYLTKQEFKCKIMLWN